MVGKDSSVCRTTGSGTTLTSNLNTGSMVHSTSAASTFTTPVHGTRSAIQNSMQQNNNSNVSNTATNVSKSSSSVVMMESNIIDKIGTRRSVRASAAANKNIFSRGTTASVVVGTTTSSTINAVGGAHVQNNNSFDVQKSSNNSIATVTSSTSTSTTAMRILLTSATTATTISASTVTNSKVVASKPHNTGSSNTIGEENMSVNINAVGCTGMVMPSAGLSPTVGAEIRRKTRSAGE